MVMKSYITAILLTVFSLNLPANPYPDPAFYIEQVRVNDGVGWQITLGWVDFFQWNITVDSVYLQFSGGSARITGNYYSIITQASLSSPLVIDTTGDVIAAIVWSDYGIYSAGVRFGDVENPWVLSPFPFQSITRPQIYQYYYMSLDDSPTWTYDTTGMCCTVTGTIYDMTGSPVCNEWFMLDYPFVTGPDGVYSTRIYSRIYTWNTIQKNWHLDIPIDPVEYTLRPDSLIFRDIHLLDTLITDIKDMNKDVPIMKVYFDHTTGKLNVLLSQDLAQPIHQYSITIVDLSGRIVHEKLLDSSIGLVSLTVNLQPGTYVACLKGDGRVINTRKFILS